MKKIVAFAAFFLLLKSIATTQETDLRLGFQLSPTFSWMGTDDNEINNNGTNLGLKLGMVSEFFFRENYAFILGLGFHFNSGGTLLHDNNSQVIWQSSGEELQPDVQPADWFGNIDLKYNIQYVEIPFGLKFRTKEFGYMRYYMEVPVITIGFKSQARGSFKNANINEEKIDIKKEVVGASLSWGLSGGIEYSVSGTTAIIAGVGFQRMFTDVTKDYSGVDSKAYINSIILRLGVMF